MNKAELCSKMEEMHKKFQNEVWEKTFLAVLSYVDENGTTDDIHHTIQAYIDDLCLSGAWIQDVLNGYTGTPHGLKYRGSLGKKIRKALGYTV